MYDAQIILDSVAPCGRRLTTWELTYPRFVHAELMTHRVFSRNSASSRAIPIKTMLERIKKRPALPVFWGKNQSGMQAAEEIEDKAAALEWWLRGMELMIAHAEEGAAMGLHKQIVNRVTEPWMLITVIVSATDFRNWFHLRDHKDAQPEIKDLAATMHGVYRTSTPQQLRAGDWHLPYIRPEDPDEAAKLITLNDPGFFCGTGMEMAVQEMLKQVSTGRCARVSYLTHDGRRDLSKDVELHDKLRSTPESGDPGHWSPFEHPAMALDKPERHGNFTGFKQYRKWFPHEAGPQEPLWFP